MKKELLALLLITGLLLSHSAFSENTKTVKATVNKATVYLRGAQLHCSSDFLASPGINHFIFEGVSPNLDVNSLQASAKGNITIMDVKFQVRYNDAPPKENPNQIDKTLKLVNDSLVMLNFEIEEYNEQLQSLTTEKNILLNNRLLKGESLRDTLDMFKEGIAFLRARLANISAETTELKKKLYYKNAHKTALQARINELNKINQTGNTAVKESVPTIVVMAYSEIQTNAKVSVSFYVDQAAWLPSYDLRANSSGTIALNYKAELRQQTGMDWNNVSLTLSTGNPALNTQKPVLTPFYINFAQNFRKKLKEENRELMSKVPSLQATAAGNEDSQDEMMLDAATLASYTEEREGMLQTEYEIKLKYSIPHDDDLHMVAIQSKEINSQFHYSAVPKMDVNAFLMADILDLSDMNLIPGSSRIYLDGSFVGKSVLNPDAFTDTIQLSLGKDRSIVLSRKKLKDKTKEKLLVDEKTILTSYEIKIKNNKSTSISLDLTDQIPLSVMADIKISLVDSDGGTLNPETGLLTWKLDLKALETKTIQFSYELKVPKSKGLAGR